MMIRIHRLLRKPLLTLSDLAVLGSLIVLTGMLILQVAPGQAIVVPEPFPVLAKLPAAQIYRVEKPGDLDGDGDLDADDWKFLKGCISKPTSAGCRPRMRFVDGELLGAPYTGNDRFVVFLGAIDLTGDGAVTLTDVAWLKQFVDDPTRERPTTLRPLCVTIAGRVTDAATGLPIPDVEIAIGAVSTQQ